MFRPYPRFSRLYRYRPNKAGIGIVACVFVLCGLSGTVFSILSRNDGKPINGGIITTGTVSSVSAKQGCNPYGHDCTPYYDFTVSFTTTKGQVVTIDENTDYPITTGATQKISYLPSDPQSAHDLSIKRSSLSSNLLFCGTMFFLGVLGLIYSFYFRKRNFFPNRQFIA
jgi:hypothetical protein